MRILERLPGWSSESRIKKYIARTFYGIGGFFIFLIILGIAVSPPSEETVSPTTTPSPQPVKEFLNISFEEFNSIFGPDSKYTDMQKDELFDSQYKNKYIKWSGEVVEISEIWGIYSLQVKHKPTTFTLVSVNMKADQKDKLLALKKGDQVTYTARLTRYEGIILGTYFADDGEIVE